MTDKEPEKLVYVEPSKVYTGMWNVLLPGGLGIMSEPTQEKAECAAMYLNTAAESFAQRRVDEALERAAVKIGADAESRKCLAYGHDDRYCSYCASYDDAIDIAQQGIRSMKSQGATNG